MEINFLDSNFKTLYILDSFESFIWSDKYWESGDVDIVCVPKNDILTALSTTKYLGLAESNYNMVVETKKIEADNEEGDKLIIQGRSLESLLERRIIWNQLSLTGSLQNAITNQILGDNVVSPTDTDRTFPNFSVLTSTDLSIQTMTIDTQFKGEDLHKVISDICRSYGLGFRMHYNKTSGNIEFLLYNGKNRSYSQSTNAHVAFTTKLDNLINSDYIESSRSQKTVALVSGESGVGNKETLIEVDAPGGGLTGYNRRELYVKANINRNTPDGELTDAEYLDRLEGKGDEELAKYPLLEAFDGEVDTTMYQYGVHFNMGDILQIADDYGHGTESRVIEMIYSQNTAGISMYPRFETT